MAATGPDSLGEGSLHNPGNSVLAARIRARLETDRMFGVDFVRRDPARDASELPGVSRVALADKAARLLVLAAKSARCMDCGLSDGRNTVVYGEGNPDAEIMFVGEAPGAEEDRQGRPFVGKAGKLLTKIIEAMGYRREQIYIANVLKCRPENNRDPAPQEVAACLPKLLEQIELVSPKVIVALGKHALTGLFGPGLGITASRGRFMEFHGTKVMPTFHPAYLLRNESAKRQVWEDMKKVMTLIQGEG